MEQNRYMAPPWLAYPALGRGPKFWESGEPAAYLEKLTKWLNGLSLEELKTYIGLFPEPAPWRGWWQNRDTAEYLEQGNLRLPLWRRYGEPKYNRNNLAAKAKDVPFCLFFHPLQDRGVQKGCFSQWWISDFTFEGDTYTCMEQFMMSGKAKTFRDPVTDREILECQDPKLIKKMGRKVQGFDGGVWDTVKYSIVLNGNWCKFSQNPILRAFLLNTGDSILAEASPFDAIWGIHLGQTVPEAHDITRWRGRNLLGFALMEVRDELKKVYANAALCGIEA